MNINYFATIVFDCDGVILNSNKVKTNAFYNAVLPYGEEAAKTFVTYHKNNGGISRYKKFEYFLENLVNQEIEESILQQLLDNYAREVRAGLLSCEITKGLDELRTETDSRWLIVSGGDQQELRDIFQQRNIAKYFSGGIFGSPDSKETILEHELKKLNIILPTLFVGDSVYDHQAARHTGIDFVFAYEWTEVSQWSDYCKAHELKFIGSVSELSTTD